MKRILLFVSVTMILAFSCQENKVLEPGDQISEIHLDVTGLRSLGDSAWYEGWLVWGDDNENFQTTGVFSVDAQGQLSQSAFHINLGYLQKAKHFLLTIEQDDIPGYIVTPKVSPDTTIIDSVAGPSSNYILAALFNANAGELSIGHELILDFDFTTAGGTYLLKTPSDAEGQYPKSGIWFVNEDTAQAIIQGLDLPSGRRGWYYNGWVDINGIAVSTGTFKNPGAPDDSSKYGESSGKEYQFPGEDFLLNPPSGLSFPVDLSSKEIYIRLYPPHPDNSNSPFAPLKPLIVTVPADANSGIIYEFESNISELPYGTVTMNVKIYE